MGWWGVVCCGVVRQGSASLEWMPVSFSLMKEDSDEGYALYSHSSNGQKM
jgi:hypothetical protein